MKYQRFVIKRAIIYGMSLQTLKGLIMFGICVIGILEAIEVHRIKDIEHKLDSIWYLGIILSIIHISFPLLSIPYYLGKDMEIKSKDHRISVFNFVLNCTLYLLALCHATISIGYAEFVIENYDYLRDLPEAKLMIVMSIPIIPNLVLMIAGAAAMTGIIIVYIGIGISSVCKKSCKMCRRFKDGAAKTAIKINTLGPWVDKP